MPHPSSTSSRSTTGGHEIPFSSSALDEYLDVRVEQRHRIVDGLERLVADPTWEGLDVQALKGRDKTYRLRVGDWRLFFTRDADLAVEAVRCRQDDTYGTSRLGTLGSGRTTPHTIEELRDLAPLPSDADEDALDEELARGQEPQEGEPLPRPLDPETLRRWHIPGEFHEAIGACRTSDDLLELEIDPRVVERVLEMLYPKDVRDAAAGPHYLVHGREELRRWAEGEISRLLLRLDPEQEALVDVQLAGPTLVRGGPGTGKTVVAIHRSLALAQEEPGRRILFATFTNTLKRYAEDLLEHLMAERGIDVDLAVCTVDELVKKHAPVPEAIASGSAPRALLARMLEDDWPAFLRELGPRYLFEEFDGLIGAHGIETQQEYLKAERRGRKHLLVHEERQQVWTLYTAWRARLKREGRITWPMLRQVALQRANPAYDAIVVDEAQDLTPVALRFLVKLSRDRRNLHLAADVGQSLYASGFSWRGVDEALDMRGRSRVLRRDHRTTRQIHAAARDLAERLDLDLHDFPTPGVVRGPAPRIISTDPAEPYAALPDLLRDLCRDLRLPLGAAAVLAPRTKIVERILFELNEAGVRAEHGRVGPEGVVGPSVKVLSLQSAKGLEYPVVVVFGVDEGVLPRVVEDYPQEERVAHRQRDARTLFVGCTRAMRALAVVHAQGAASSFLRELSGERWRQVELHGAGHSDGAGGHERSTVR